MAALDVKKAFDRVHHTDLLASMLRSGIGARLIATLRSFDLELHAKVFLWDGAESKPFPMQRGVRQGDPLSTLLFNLVLNEVLEEVRATWDRRGYGAAVGYFHRGPGLTHVAFADDCTLAATSWTSLKRMILQLREALHRRGLSLHPSKCQVQTNDENWNTRGKVSLGEDFAIEFLPTGEPLSILGTALALTDATQMEVRYRLAAGWRSFWSLKSLLLNTRSCLKHRLRLFDSTVGSCVLWCAQSWSLRGEEIRSLRTAQRSMLRRIVGARRGPDEGYVDWIRRTTRKALALAAKSNVRDWVEAHALYKWNWAGHVSRRPLNTWVWRTTTWRDADWQSAALEVSSRPLRPSRRRWTKWEDCLRRFCATEGCRSWTAAAQCRDDWSSRADSFVKWFVRCAPREE